MSQPENVRIDNRLIHGQVAALWTKSLKINRIVVIDDEVIKDKMRRSLLKMATPAGIKLSMISPKRAAENFLSDRYAEEVVMVIVAGPEMLQKVKDEGFVFESVNVANMPSKPNAKTITRTIYINEEEEAVLRALSKDTRFYTQLAPNDRQEDFIQLLDKA